MLKVPSKPRYTFLYIQKLTIWMNSQYNLFLLFNLEDFIFAFINYINSSFHTFIFSSCVFFSYGNLYLSYLIINCKTKLYIFKNYKYNSYILICSNFHFKWQLDRPDRWLRWWISATNLYSSSEVEVIKYTKALPKHLVKLLVVSRPVNEPQPTYLRTANHSFRFFQAFLIKLIPLIIISGHDWFYFQVFPLTR